MELRLPGHLAVHGFVAFLLVAFFVVVHLAIAPLVGLGVDEAHYALYALHPALSYFDHPPMVGWLQLLVAPVGYNDFTVRLVPILLFALINLQLFRLTNAFYPSGNGRQGLVAVVLFCGAPILQLMGWGLVPDLPLIFLALLIIPKVLAVSRNGRLADWLWLGVLFGLAGLSKYTAVFLPVGLFLFLLINNGWRWLFTPGPWLAAVIALLIISPVIVWNMQHQWASFDYQLNHAKGGGWSWRDLLRMQLFQLICYSFVVYLGGILASLFALKRRQPEDLLLLFFGWPFLLVVSWSSARGEILANWPAMGWVLLMPLIADWLCVRWQRLGNRILCWGSGLLSAFLILFVFAFLAFRPLSLFPFMQPLLRDLEGWDQASVRAVELKQEHNGAEYGVLLVNNWSRASRVAWYAKTEAVRLMDDNKQTQFDFWWQDYPAGSDGILILDNEEVPETGVLNRGDYSCQYLESLRHDVDGITVNDFNFFLCRSVRAGESFH